MSGQLGNSLARIRWSSATRDDLAIGAPFAGAIYVFNGGAALPSGTVQATSAPRRITVNPTFNWVRLAQRVPVRIHIDEVPDGVLLAAGITCTVVVRPEGEP